MQPDTKFLVIQGIDSTNIVKTAYAKYNLSIGVGLSKVAGKVFRIGHLGNCDEIMSASALAGKRPGLAGSASHLRDLYTAHVGVLFAQPDTA